MGVGVFVLTQFWSMTRPKRSRPVYWSPPSFDVGFAGLLDVGQVDAGLGVVALDDGVQAQVGVALQDGAGRADYRRPGR